MSLEFKVSEKQLTLAKEFLEKCKQEELNRQKESLSPDEFNRLTNNGTAPYTGAIGGGTAYTFIPTSIGIAVTVKDLSSGKELDLTDYDSW